MFIKRSGDQPLRLILSVLLFAGVLLLFSWWIGSFSGRNDTRSREILENALRRDIMECYAAEGRYPESLDYITEHYGLIYDDTRFYIDYRVTGSNIYPDYTILEMED